MKPVAWMKQTCVSPDWDAYDFSANQSEEFSIPLVQAPPDGYALVPIEPTDEMLDAAWVAGDAYGFAGLRRAWAAMLKASHGDLE